ncbi:hypothetical protein AB0D49_25870 [Streptomyces sp. NPDC048290]|uniref:hypothetical protein n=1 Tax=Streptomyces sp. NPDC048290 TaxID=3155811 RepID=UPI003432C11C
MTDQRTAENAGQVRDETLALLQDRSRPEPVTDADVLKAMADVDKESVTLIKRAARGLDLDTFEVAAFQRRHAWLAVRLPRFADDDPGLAASLTTAAEESVTAWLDARDHAVRVSAGWHPRRDQPANPRAAVVAEPVRRPGEVAAHQQRRLPGR